MQSLADIAGTGATVPLNTPNITARWIQLAVTGTGTVKFGGSNASATNGIPIPAGGYFFLPVIPGHESTTPYGLQGNYAYIPSGATLSIAYEPFTG